MPKSREEKASEKLGDIFADERLNVVQLGYCTVLSFTPAMIERLKGWIQWHDKIADSINIRDDGGIEYLDSEYLKYISLRRNT